MKLRIVIAGLLIGLAAFAADNGAELFQAAVTQERAAGNLEEAIKLYQRVAKEFASDRALASKALVAEARCYEKLGQNKADQATKLYEQVARDYRDQPDQSATARERLAVLQAGSKPKAGTGMTAQAQALQREGWNVGPFTFYSARQNGGANALIVGAMMRHDDTKSQGAGERHYEGGPDRLDVQHIRAPPGCGQHPQERMDDGLKSPRSR